VFPRLFHARIPRYESIAEQFGYVVNTEELAGVVDEHSFNRLVESAIARKFYARPAA